MLEQVEQFIANEGIKYKKGSEYLSICCPFAKKTHEDGKDNNPSFVIYPSRNFAKCFSCGAYFGLEEFLAEYSNFNKKNFDFEWLNTIITIPREEKKIINYELPDDIMKGFDKNTPKITEYLKTRGIYKENLHFDLFHDRENNNIIQEIRNGNSKIIGATSRNLNNWGVKSHHYFGVVTSKCLLGLGCERFEIPDKAIIVEGLTDLWSAYDTMAQLESQGIEIRANVYATLTASLSDYQAVQLLDLDVPLLLAYDVDLAGKKGRKKAKEKLKGGLLTEVTWSNSKMDVGNMNLDWFNKLFGG